MDSSIRVTPPAKDTVHPTHLVATTSLVIALCILGDSLMYSILPLEAGHLDISLPLVGVLLSANRLIRLISNGWASTIYERFGPRRPLIGAAILGLISTVLYGVGWGFALFLGARMLWGIAWSGLRQGGYQAVWHGGQATKGRLTGLLWGIVRLGSATAVLGGGFLYDRYGYTTTIAVVATLTAAALPVALSIQWPTTAHNQHVDNKAKHESKQHNKQMQWSVWLDLLRTPLVRWLLGAGAIQLFLSGIVVSTTSIYLAERLQVGENTLLFGIGVATITGLLQGVRWLSDITVGPTIGRLSDHFGQSLMALLLCLTSTVAIFGLVTLTDLWALLALFLYFLCDSGINVTLSAAASGVAMHHGRPHYLIGAYTTAGDLGSALGPLLAFSIGRYLGLPITYAFTAIIGLLVVVRYITLQRKSR
ncbi:MAG TPA: MFS transporter [Caldilineaceae bacterium]|nr:MFS transporter [Caldilineaceae bacterium]